MALPRDGIIRLRDDPYRDLKALAASLVGLLLAVSLIGFWILATGGEAGLAADRPRSHAGPGDTTSASRDAAMPEEVSSASPNGAPGPESGDVAMAPQALGPLLLSYAGISRWPRYHGVSQ